MDHQGVAFTYKNKQSFQFRTIYVLAGRPVGEPAFFKVDVASTV
jgi:hypothetical protein